LSLIIIDNCSVGNISDNDAGDAGTYIQLYYMALGGLKTATLFLPVLLSDFY
jgi:hypothetical protein